LVTGANPKGHYEQLYDRAIGTLENASLAFEEARTMSEGIRSQEDSLEEVKAKISDAERAVTSQLIEIYGSPYSDDIGPGKTFPQDYVGPDLVHYLYVDMPETDEALRLGLQACTRPADAVELAASMGRSMQWMRRRAAQLGLQIPQRPERPWQQAETAVLRENAHLPAPELAKVLRRAGFMRTPGAVALRLRQAKLDRTCPNTHPLADVAMLLGVSPQTVLVWTQQHGLRTTRRQPDTGGQGHRYRIHRKDLRAWLRDNPTRIDLAKVDAPWFLDLALGAHQ
jgi:hypothetical protein